jgi:hypothetical protein
MSTISHRVAAALDLVEDQERTTGARRALAEYEARRTIAHRDVLLTSP